MLCLIIVIILFQSSGCYSNRKKESRDKKEGINSFIFFLFKSPSIFLWSMITILGQHFFFFIIIYIYIYLDYVVPVKLNIYTIIKVLITPVFK